MGQMFFMLLDTLYSRALACYSLPWQLFHLVLLVEREIVMKIISIKEFYKSLIYFVFIIINATFNQLNIL